MNIQDSVRQIDGVIDCVYNNECYSLTVYVEPSWWPNLMCLKIRLQNMLQIKMLDNFFDRIIYTTLSTGGQENE